MAYAFDLDEEIDPPSPTREEVEADLVEWQQRLASLMDTLQSWVPNDGRFQITRHDTYSCEPRMMTVGIRETRPFPALMVEPVPMPDDPPRRTLHIKADARWVLLTEGRLLVFHPGGMTYIEDHGQAGKPEWLIYPQRAPIDGAPLNRDEFLLLLEGLR